MAAEWAEIPAYRDSLADGARRASGAPLHRPRSSAAPARCTRRRGGCSRTGSSSPRTADEPRRAECTFLFNRAYSGSESGAERRRSVAAAENGASSEVETGARIAHDRAAAEDARGGAQRPRAAPSGSPRSPREIEREGIEYVFFQQVSITGHVMARASSRASSRRSPSAATSSSTARPPTCSPTGTATTSASAPRSPSSPRSPTSTPSPCLPWDPRVARVYCDCYDTETGELLDADPRQNLKRVAHEFEEELGLHVPVGIEPEMMWLKPADEDGARPRA